MMRGERINFYSVLQVLTPFYAFEKIIDNNFSPSILNNRRFEFSSLISQSIILWPSKTKSLLSSLYKREEFPLFGKEGSGEIFITACLFNYGLLSNLTTSSGKKEQ